MTIKEAIEYAKGTNFCAGCTDYECNDGKCGDCTHKSFFEMAIKALTVYPTVEAIRYWWFGDEEMDIKMTFPETVEEYMEEHKMVDTEHIYSNGTEYVPIFRMKQWFAHMEDDGK